MGTSAKARGCGEACVGKRKNILGIVEVKAKRGARMARVQNIPPRSAGRKALLPFAGVRRERHDKATKILNTSAVVVSSDRLRRTMEASQPTASFQTGP
jgi:hypothetical protein